MTHKIGWLNRPGTTGETWNPVTGCTKISAGCKNCYAERMSKRLKGRFGYPADGFSVAIHPDKLEQPLRWKNPRTVFVCSMGDLFHKDVPLDYIVDVFDIMAQCEQHTFIVLTKRPQRMTEAMDTIQNWDVEHVGWTGRCPRHLIDRDMPLPLPNVWGLVTAENQKQADARIPLLLQCRFAVRGVSIEPMLGAVNLEEYWGEPGVGLDWVIVGAETGPGARTMDPDDARNVQGQCCEVGVPYFFKQMSAKAPIPDDLLVREWPGGGQ